MAAATITPLIARPTDSPNMQLIEGSQVAAGEEHLLDVRAANTTMAEVLVRLAIVPPGADPELGGLRAFDVKVPANDARDLERGLPLPEGWSLSVRQSGPSGAVEITVTGRKRSAA